MSRQLPIKLAAKSFCMIRFPRPLLLSLPILLIFHASHFMPTCLSLHNTALISAPSTGGSKNGLQYTIVVAPPASDQHDLYGVGCMMGLSQPKTHFNCSSMIPTASLICSAVMMRGGCSTKNSNAHAQGVHSKGDGISSGHARRSMHNNNEQSCRACLLCCACTCMCASEPGCALAPRGG